MTVSLSQQKVNYNTIYTVSTTLSAGGPLHVATNWGHWKSTVKKTLLCPCPPIMGIRCDRAHCPLAKVSKSCKKLHGNGKHVVWANSKNNDYVVKWKLKKYMRLLAIYSNPKTHVSAICRFLKKRTVSLLCSSKSKDRAGFYIIIFNDMIIRYYWTVFHRSKAMPSLKPNQLG